MSFLVRPNNTSCFSESSFIENCIWKIFLCKFIILNNINQIIKNLIINYINIIILYINKVYFCSYLSPFILDVFSSLPRNSYFDDDSNCIVARWFHKPLLRHSSLANVISSNSFLIFICDNINGMIKRLSISFVLFFVYIACISQAQLSQFKINSSHTSFPDTGRLNWPFLQ